MVIDKKLLTLYFVFLVLSCTFIFSSSVPVANRINVDSYYFFKHQILFSFISIFITITLSFFNEKLLKKYSISLFIFAFILLIMVPFIGFQTKGARRWIYIFGISIQPTEIIKPMLIILNAYFLEKYSLLKEKKYVISSVILCICCLFLIYKQPDIGNLLLIITVFITQIFLTDIINFKKMILVIPLLLVIPFTAYLTLPHVSNRIDSFIDSLKDPSKTNYQTKRSLIAYKNAGIVGRGFMEGEVKNFIPDVHTDFIFPAITEEFGFVIALLIIFLYFYFTLRILLKNRKIENNYFKFLSSYGLALLFLIQSVVNISVSLNLLPTKGITLPLLSYGGSSLISSSFTIGFILILTKQTYDAKINTDHALDLTNMIEQPLQCN